MAHKCRSRAPAMMTEPLWWRLSAGRRFAQGLADLRFEKRTRFLFVGETMIRHASPSRTVTATSGSVHGATTWSCLIAPPSFPLLVAARFLRAGSDAIVLAAIALPTDKNLRAVATTHKRPASHFIGTVRHITPPAKRRFRSASSPEPLKHAAVLGPVKAKPFGWPRRRGQP